MSFKQIIKSIKTEEWLFVGLICVLLMVITIFPVILAYATAPAQTHYNGLNIIGIGDYAVYYSYINQVKAGHILLLDYFTSEPQSGGILNIFWLGVGLMAWIFNLSAPLAFHLSRLVMIPVFCVIFYIFSGYIFSEKKLRQWSLVFAAFASGFGGYVALIVKNDWQAALHWTEYATPVDLWVTESNIFFSIYENPHFILSFALMILFSLLLLLAWENKSYKYSILAGLTGLIWYNFHPYYAPYMLAISFIFLLYIFYRDRKIAYIYQWLIAIGLGMISVGYHYYLSKTDYIIGTKMIQNLTITPSLAGIFLGFGFMLIFGLLAVYFLAKNFKMIPDKYAWLLIWLVVGLNLLYAPLNFNRRFTEGLQIPAIFLCVYFLDNIVMYLSQHRFKIFRLLSKKYFLIPAFMVLFCFSSLFIIIRDIGSIRDQDPIFYFSDEYLEAANWLSLNNQNRVILTHKYNGHNLPGIINQQVFIGHGHETAEFTAKDRMTDDFYANKYSQDQALEFLKANNIGYILAVDWEKRNMAINLDAQPYLEQVFSNNQTTIYKVSAFDGNN